MSLKDITYLELCQPFFSDEWNHLCNFGRRHREEQFCEIIMNLDQWFRRCGRYFLSGALVALCLAERIHLCNSVTLF